MSRPTSVRQLGAEAAVQVMGAWHIPAIQIGGDEYIPTVRVLDLSHLPQLGVRERQLGANCCWIAGVLPTAKITHGEYRSMETPHGTVTVELGNGVKLPVVLIGQAAMKRAGWCTPGEKVVVGGPIVFYQGALGLRPTQWARAW